MRYKYISFFLLFLISDLLSAQSITSSTQMPWFNHVSSLDEIVGLRSRNTKHFINGENKQKAFVSISSIHYKENEEWKEIKYEIVPSIEKPNYYQNTTNNFHTFYPKELGALPLITTIENYSVSEQFIGISFLDKNYKSISENHTSFNKVSIEGNKAKYQSNISSLVYEYSQLSDGRKSDLVLQDVQFLKNAPQTTKYVAIKEIIELPSGWKVLKGENGINIYDEKNIWRVNYETPVAYEEKIDKEDDLNKGEIYFNILSNNKVEIISLFNYKWLAQSNREYPLHLDPVVTYNPFNVTYATGYMTGPSAGKASGIMRLAGVGHISWAKFNIGALASTGITSVIDAKYHGYHYTAAGSPNKIATIKGLANIDPTIAANTAISGRTSIAPSYNPTFVYGTWYIRHQK